MRQPREGPRRVTSNDAGLPSADVILSAATHIVSATFTQGALGAIPSGSIEIDLAAGSDRAVLVAPPVGLKQKTCSLVVSEVGTDVRARLGTMTLVQPD